MGPYFFFLCLGGKIWKDPLDKFSTFLGNSRKSSIKMTRGNQRDLAREKAAKKAQKGKSASESAANAGLTVEQRKERDADIMRQKQEKKAAAAAEKASGSAKK